MNMRPQNPKTADKTGNKPAKKGTAATTAHPPAKRQRSHSVKIGNRQITAQGLKTSIWQDLSHRGLTASWPAFILSAAILFIGVNILFAFAYSLGDEPIANMPERSLLYYFYFSIETLATVGYGDMHPKTHYAHIIAGIESFTGLFLIAVMTGMIFSRFSRPQARVLFVRNPVIALHNGQRVLMVRIANERINTISNATAKLWLLRQEKNLEGRQFRVFMELPLMRSENPVFMLSWTLFHIIDETSPLFGQRPGDLTASDTGLTLTINGLDENSSQYVHARHAYTHSDIRWNHSYVDILQTAPGNKVMLDYSKFHDLEAEAVLEPDT